MIRRQLKFNITTKELNIPLKIKKKIIIRKISYILRSKNKYTHLSTFSFKIRMHAKSIMQGFKHIVTKESSGRARSR